MLPPSSHDQIDHDHHAYYPAIIIVYLYLTKIAKKVIYNI